MTLTFPKLSAETITPHIAAPTRTIINFFWNLRVLLAQNNDNFKYADFRPQFFKSHSDKSNTPVKRTAKMILGTPLDIRNVIVTVKKV